MLFENCTVSIGKWALECIAVVTVRRLAFFNHLWLALISPDHWCGRQRSLISPLPIVIISWSMITWPLSTSLISADERSALLNSADERALTEKKVGPLISAATSSCWSVLTTFKCPLALALALIRFSAEAADKYKVIIIWRNNKGTRIIRNNEIVQDKHKVNYIILS